MDLVNLYLLVMLSPAGIGTLLLVFALGGYVGATMAKED